MFDLDADNKTKYKLDGRYQATVTLGYSHLNEDKEYDMHILASLGNMHLDLGLVSLIFTHDKKLCITKAIRTEEGKLYEHWLMWDDNGQLVWSRALANLTDDKIFAIDLDEPDHKLGGLGNGQTRNNE